MFKGSMVALVTPMIEDTVDVSALRELVEYHIDSGTHVLVANGTTGESATLSHAEKRLVISTVIEQAKGRVPVVAGSFANATRECIEMTREVMELGAHAALIMTPAYIKPTQQGLYDHYSSIAKEVPIPIILYNVPSRTACDILPETVAKLARISNIVGIKEATGQMERLTSIMELCQGSLDIYSGDDLTVAEWMLAGAKGAISVTANVAAKAMARLCELGLDKNRAECLAIQEQLMPLHRLMFVESNPIPVKWAVSRMGLMGGEIRMPMTPFSSQYHQEMENVLHALDLL